MGPFAIAVLYCVNCELYISLVAVLLYMYVYTKCSFNCTCTCALEYSAQSAQLAPDLDYFTNNNLFNKLGHTHTVQTQLSHD